MTLSAEDAALVREALVHLRRLAIVGVQTPGVRTVLICAHRCKICHSVWAMDESEKHDISCVLQGSDL